MFLYGVHEYVTFTLTLDDQRFDKSYRDKILKNVDASFAISSAAE